ncbi:MAG: hypothetical protein AB1352_03075 [Patescibacteria group bacterium]
MSLTRHQTDFVVMIATVALGIFISYTLLVPPLVGGFLCLFIPSLYLIVRERKNLAKIGWAVILFGAVFGFIFDFIVTFNRGWIVSRLVFNYRLFGFYPLIDDVVGFMLMTLFVVVFYEHFLDDEKRPVVSKDIMYGFIPSCIVLVLLLVVYKINPEWLQISNVYLVTGTAAIMFPLIVGWKNARLRYKMLAVAAFFFCVWFIIELVAVAQNDWIFPGEYIGIVSIGRLTFPFEELFFWMMCYAATVVAYYEYLIDDRR